MKKTLFVLLFFLIAGQAAFAAAQEKPKPSESSKPAENSRAEEKSRSPIPLRIQLVFTEFDGDKKIVSLPYSFSVNADEHHARPDTQIRDGVRLPVPTGKDQFQYVDVGTNIDCSAQSEDAGRYKLVLSVARNSVSGDAPSTLAPVIRNFQAEMNPILKDGQTFETVMATDPANGHVYRVTVTLTVPK